MEEREPTKKLEVDPDNFRFGELFAEYVRWNRVKNSRGPFSSRNKGKGWGRRDCGGEVLCSYFHKIYTGIPVGQLLLCRRSLTWDKGLYWQPVIQIVRSKTLACSTKICTSGDEPEQFAYRRPESLILYVLCIPNSVNNIYGNAPRNFIETFLQEARYRRGTRRIPF